MSATVLMNSNFYELSNDEVSEISGGGWLSAAVTTVGFVALAAGAVMAVGMLPAVAVVAVTAKTVVVSQSLIWGGGAVMGAGGLL